MSALFTVGRCPNCPGYCDVFVVGHHRDPELILYCPGCGCAWEVNGQFDEGAEAFTLESMAPNGLRLPTQGEVQSVPGAQEAPPHDVEAWLSAITARIPAPPPTPA
jgi:hypothetical protein